MPLAARRSAFATAAMLALVFAIAAPAQAETVLRLFAAGQMRAEAFREAIERFTSANPEIKVELVGGESVAEQRAFLNKALASREAAPAASSEPAKEPALDLALIDVIHAAQWANARWIEPLDAHLGTARNALAADWLPGSRAAATVGGRLFALPFTADAQLMFYRKDLVAKYGLTPPQDWEALKRMVETITKGEDERDLRGFEAPAAAVESGVCTFLAPLWGSGEGFLKAGRPDPEGAGTSKALALWADLKAVKAIAPDMGSVATDRVRQNFQGGSVIFASGWSYMWRHFQSDADSQVKDAVGIAPLPGFTGTPAPGCIGGWQVAVMSASTQKPAAIRLARHLGSPEVARLMALKAGAPPVFRSLYRDPEIVAAQPWMAEALPVFERAEARPVHPRYGEISEAIRLNLHAVVAGTKTPEAAVQDMKNRYALIFR
jgi:multiple sugar transport system substrate-binding protein